jgi:hypothetical protein
VLEKIWRKWDYYAMSVGMQAMETVLRFLEKLTTVVPDDSATPFLGKHSKELKVASQRDICKLMFIAAL